MFFRKLGGSCLIPLLILVVTSKTLHTQICDIKTFLDACPTEDPAFDKIMSDFEIRVDDVLITDFPCSGSIDDLPVAEYTDALVYLQTLRTIYYMDKHLTNHLAWTSLTMYDWMDSLIDGINIRTGVFGGFCCNIIDGKRFIVVGAANDFNREFDKEWMGISGNISFVSHEVRHAEPSRYLHTQTICCASTACDQTYDVNDLGAYAIQYWLHEQWLTGNLDVGVRTSHTLTEINSIINWHNNGVIGTATRFCDNIPTPPGLGSINNPVGIVDDNCCQDVIIYPNASLISDDIIAEELITLSGSVSQPNLQLSAKEIIFNQGYCSPLGLTVQADNNNCTN